jgi:hypothetical protein
VHARPRVSASSSNGFVTVSFATNPRQGRAAAWSSRWLDELSRSTALTVMMSTAEVGPMIDPSPPSPLHLYFSNLGLGLLFQFDSEIDSFLFPNKIYNLARLWYH